MDKRLDWFSIVPRLNAFFNKNKNKRVARYKTITTSTLVKSNSYLPTEINGWFNISLRFIPRWR